MQGAGILPLMWDFITGTWEIPAFLIGATAVVTIINAVKRGSDV